MAMERINGTPLFRQGILERFRGSDTRPGTPGQDAGASAGGAPAGGADKADISDAARRLVDLRRAVDTGRAALASLPDVRPEKVAAARERLATGFYQTAAVRESVADSVAGVVQGLDTL
jgi:hypothetical protein